jgi:ligand-binding sensor domain-containing protein/serine phosphatase RsbU (regulator of sigma subunit)
MNSFFKILYITLIACITLNACETKTNKSLNASSTPAQVVQLNLEQGYRVNPATKDSIAPIVNPQGAKLVTGKPILAKPQVIKLDKKNLPKRFYSSGLQTKLQKPNSQLKLFPASLVPVANNDTFALSNSKKTQIISGKPVMIKGRVVPFSAPKLVKGKAPVHKNNAKFDIQSLDVDQGLASSYVYNSFLDSRGYMWFATYTGVSRYDGANFMNLKQENGLSNDWTYAVTEDMQGNMWFGSRGGGLSKFDGKNFTHFTQKEGLPSNWVVTLLHDSKGNIWFGCAGKGLSKFDGKTFTHFTEKEGLPNNSVISIFEDKSGNIWAGTTNGVCVFDGISFRQMVVDGGKQKMYVVQSIAEDRQGNMWFGTRHGGVFEYDGRTMTQWTKENGLPNNDARAITVDRAGQVWVSTFRGGISQHKEGRFVTIDKNDGLSSQEILSVFEDKDDQFWVATFGGGINKFKPKSFVHFDDKQELKSHQVIAMCQGSSNRVLFGTRGGGLTIYNGQTFSNFGVKDGIPDKTISALIYDKKGRLWMGSYGRGLAVFDGKAFTYYGKKHGLAGYHVHALTEDSQGNIWVGTETGISKYDGHSFTNYNTQSGLINPHVYAIYEDSQGNIWIGTRGAGIVKFDGTYFIHYTQKEGLSHNLVSSIIEDQWGDLWIGTEGGGLNKFDGERFVYYNSKTGLSHDIVWSITKDKQQRIWVGTEKGLNCIVSQKAGKSRNEQAYKIFQYDKSLGLRGVDFWHKSALYDKKGYLWWGTGKCLTRLNTQTLELPNTKPAASLDVLGINDLSLDYRQPKAALKENMRYTNTVRFQNYPLGLKLSHHLNHLTFYFTAADWATPQSIKYAYKIDNLETKWSVAQQDNRADYRNLPYGKHTFMVKAKSALGQWGEVFSYDFEIYPPWWATWWAKLIYGMAALASIFAFVRWRTLSLKRKQRILEGMVKERTVELAAQKEEVESQRDFIKEQSLEIQAAYDELKTNNEELIQSQEEITAQRDLLETKNVELSLHKKRIGQSILAAQLIQNAVLPSHEVLSRYFSNYFILHRAKDVVSGDFYWAAKVEEQMLLVVGDCTGHGVPGAFMTLISHTLLNKIVINLGETNPANILERLHEEIKIVLRQEESKYNAGGLDAVIINVEDKEGGTKAMSFAGAKNDLVYFEPQSHTAEIIKGTRKSVGGIQPHREFICEYLILPTGTTLYLGSDGYEDQNDPKRKKFGKRRLRDLMSTLVHNSLEKQQELFEQALQEHMKDAEQRDDILLMGVRL